MYIGNQVTNNPYIIDTFNGTGSATSFGPLVRAPAGDASIAVYVGGLYKTPSIDYTVNGTQIFFTTAPASGTRNIVILHLGTGSAAGIPPDSTITTAKIADRSITGPKIGLGAISQNNIAIGTITGNLIATNAIRGANQIVAGTITGNLLGLNSITGNLIVANTIGGDRIGTGAITGNLIVASTIGGDRIAPGTLSGNLLGTNALSANNVNTAIYPAILSSYGSVANFQIYTSPGIFTIPSSAKKLKFTIVGAGGGSGGVKSGVNDTSSGGGGGGETTITQIDLPGTFIPTYSNTIYVGVGVGGNGGFANVSNLTAGLQGGQSNVFLSTPSNTQTFLFFADGGFGSVAITGPATPIVAGNVNSGQGGAGGRRLQDTSYIWNGVPLPFGTGNTPQLAISAYDGYRGNNGAVNNMVTSANSISNAGLSYGMGRIGSGGLGVRVAAPGLFSPGLPGANGAVLIEY